MKEKLEEKLKYYTDEANQAFENSKFYTDQIVNGEGHTASAILSNTEINKYRYYKELKELTEILLEL